MKIFQCDNLTTNESVVKVCDGGRYQECSICTLNRHPEKKVVKRNRSRPPLIVVDDIGKKDIERVTTEELMKVVKAVKYSYSGKK